MTLEQRIESIEEQVINGLKRITKMEEAVKILEHDQKGFPKYCDGCGEKIADHFASMIKPSCKTCKDTKLVPTWEHYMKSKPCPDCAKKCDCCKGAGKVTAYGITVPCSACATKTSCAEDFKSVGYYERYGKPAKLKPCEHDWVLYYQNHQNDDDRKYKCLKCQTIRWRWLGISLEKSTAPELSDDIKDERALENKLRYEAQQADAISGTNISRDVKWDMVANIAKEHFKQKFEQLVDDNKYTAMTNNFIREQLFDGSKDNT